MREVGGGGEGGNKYEFQGEEKKRRKKLEN